MNLRCYNVSDMQFICEQLRGRPVGLTEFYCMWPINLGCVRSSDYEPFSLQHMYDANGFTDGYNNYIFHMKATAPTQFPLTPFVHSFSYVQNHGSWGNWKGDVVANPGSFHVHVSGYINGTVSTGTLWYDYDVVAEFSASEDVYYDRPKVIVTSTNYLLGSSDREVLDGPSIGGKMVSIDTTQSRTTNWRYYQQLLERSKAPDAINWYQLYSEALEDISMDTNMLENAKDAFDLIKAISHPAKALASLAEYVVSPAKGPTYRSFVNRKVDPVTNSWKVYETHLVGEYPEEALRRRARDGWMQYRYSYMTTLLDIQELMKYMSTQPHNSFQELWDYSHLLHTYRSGKQIGDTVYHYACRLSRKTYPNSHYTIAQLGGFFDAMTINLRRYGMYPTMENLWDLVPLSFVYDWVVPFGTWCSERADADWVSSYFRVHDCVSSSKTIVDVGDVTITSYTRSPLLSPPQFEYYPSSTSTKTVFMRVVDGIAMLTH